MPQPPDVLRGPHVLEYPYKRSLGPVLSRFFTSLRDRVRYAPVGLWGQSASPAPRPSTTASASTHSSNA